MVKEAILALEDGRTFRGLAWGALAEAKGEIVFNTAMTGYQEIFTDPSYARADRDDDLPARSAITA